MLTIFNRETNEGKIYTQKDSIDILFACKAEAFNIWFESNYYELEQYFKNKQGYDGNLLTETYLRVYENILHRGNDVKNYKAFFIHAYYRILLNDKVYQNRFCELSPCYERNDIDSEYHQDIEEANKTLERKIFEFVYSFYPIQEYEIFKMYINLQPSVSYKSLAKITGYKYWYIQRIVSTIKEDITQNKDRIKTGEIYHMNNDKPIKQLDQSYIFCKDYETLWSLRIRSNYTIICIVDVKGSKSVANMTPNGEIFSSDNCFSDFEGISKSEFIKQCEELGVEYIKPNFPEAVQANLFEI